MVLWVHVTNKICYISLSIRPMVTKRGEVVFYSDGLRTFWWCGIVRSCYKLRQSYPFLEDLCMGTKLGKMVTYHKRFPNIKSRDPLIAWPVWYHVTKWKTIPPLSQDLRPANFVACSVGEGPPATKSYDPLIKWSCGVIWQTKSVIISALFHYCN